MPPDRPDRILPRDRLMGGLVGLVVGDALGVPVEFCRRPERDRDPVRGMRGFGTHLQPVGTWSDDGALAMAHAAAFTAHGWDPQQHLLAFQSWYDRAAFTAHGTVFDVGSATLQALRRFKRGRPISEVGGRGDRDNGNGSLMRILPASCWWAGFPMKEALPLVGEASALTHAHPRSRLCCAWHAVIADGLLGGRSIADILASCAPALLAATPASEHAVFASLVDQTCLELPRDQVPSDGYVVSTLIAACWCLHRHPTYAEAVLEAVNLGDDTDTTAAVTGGLAGLRCGVSGIPKPWITCLPRSVMVLALAERFADACLARHRGGHGT